MSIDPSPPEQILKQTVVFLCVRTRNGGMFYVFSSNMTKLFFLVMFVSQWNLTYLHRLHYLVYHRYDSHKYRCAFYCTLNLADFNHVIF